MLPPPALPTRDPLVRPAHSPIQERAISKGRYWMMSPLSMTQMSRRMLCIALKRTKWGSFSLRTTRRNMAKKTKNGVNWLL